MKILTLNSKHFITGVSPSVHIDNQGIFSDSSVGVSPFIDAQTDSIQWGLLQTTSAPSQLGAGTIVDTPQAGVARITGSDTGTLYMYGDGGHIYSMNLATNAISDLRTVANSAKGLALYKATGDTNTYLLYWQTTQIGKYGDLDGTPGFTDNAFTGLTSTTHHPVHPFFDEIYYGNANFIGKIYSNANAPANSVNVLDFPPDYLVACLSDDGQNLVAGITKNLGDDTLSGSTKIIFWDLQSTSWNKEWLLPEANIVAIKKMGVWLYAICTGGIYAFNYETPPTKVLPVSSGTNRLPYGNTNAVDVWNNILLWGASQRINSFGKFSPTAPTTMFQPFKTIPSDFPKWISANIEKGTLYYGINNKLYAQGLTDAGATSISANTIYFKPEKPVVISEIELIFGEPLASGDSLNIDIQSDEDTTAVDVGTASFATHGAVRKIRLPLVNAFNPAYQFKLVFNFNGGNVKIKEVNVYGDYLDA